MITKEIVYKDDQYNVTLTVKQATVLDGMTRSVLIAQMFAQPIDENITEEKARFRRVLLLHTYPACIAATDFKNGKAKKKLTAEIASEDFLRLPDSLVYEWEKAVFELNPHWEVGKKPTKKEETKGEAAEPNGDKS